MDNLPALLYIAHVVCLVVQTGKVKSLRVFPGDLLSWSGFEAEYSVDDNVELCFEAHGVLFF
jgi:hypothetical protein